MGAVESACTAGRGVVTEIIIIITDNAVCVCMPAASGFHRAGDDYVCCCRRENITWAVVLYSVVKKKKKNVCVALAIFGLSFFQCNFFFARAGAGGDLSKRRIQYARKRKNFLKRMSNTTTILREFLFSLVLYILL